MNSRDSLGDRMKRHEDVTRLRLMTRMPVIIRLDGKAFHTLTRGMEKPYDKEFSRAMQSTALYLCQQVQCCRLAYVQSDEISLLLVDYEEINTAAWFDADLRKIVSISAAMASVSFDSHKHLTNHLDAHPVFDSRAWNLPREEVCNYFIWRQQDAVRNSIQSLAQAHFSAKEIHGLSCPKLQEKLFTEKGVNWNDLPAVQKRGSCVRRVLSDTHPVEPGGRQKHEWMVDREPPTFTQDRSYIERLVYPAENQPKEDK